MNRLFAFFLCWLLCCGLLFSQQEYLIQFRFDDCRLDTTYRNNAISLMALQSRLACMDIADVDSLLLVAYASPEGVLEHNLLLSKRRVETVADYLRQLYPALDDKLILRSGGENWQGLRQLVLADSMLTDDVRAKMVSLLDDDVNVGTKKWRMQQWELYPYLYQRYYPSLRSALACILYTSEHREEVLYLLDVEGVSVADSMAQTVAGKDSLPRLAVDTWQETSKAVYLRSNLLCPLMHVGVEFPLGRAYSLGFDYAYPWLMRRPDHRNCFQMLAWSMEARYWWAADGSMLGHSLGLDLGVAYYDVERQFQGRQGELLSVAAVYRYAWPIFNERWHLHVGLSLGYVFSVARPYDVFVSGGKAYRRAYTQRWQYLGPTECEIALVLPIKWRKVL